MTKDIEQRFREARAALMKAREKEFAEAVIEAGASYDRYVLAQVRQVRRRLRLLAVEVDTIGVALKRGWIDGDCAVEWLNEVATLDCLILSEPPPALSDDGSQDADVTNEICKSSETLIKAKSDSIVESGN